MQYEVAEIDEFDKFLDLKEDWNLLLSKSHYDVPFLRHEWLCLWWEHFGGNNRLAIVVIRKAGQLVFAIPLMEIRESFFGFSFQILASVTNYHSYRYHFLMSAGEEDALKAFWHYLKNRERPWHQLRLNHVPSDVKSYELVLWNAYADGYKAEIFYGSESPYLLIKGGWVEYFESLKQKFRSNIRNRTKRLNKVGEVSYEAVCDSQNIGEALAEGLDIEKKSWKGKAGTAIACDTKLTSFYTQWAHTAAKHEWLQLSFLKINDKRVAFDYSLKYQNRLYCMKIGYDPDFHKYSVGQLLCAEILKRCFISGVSEYDFLGKTTAQKRDWTSDSRKNVWVFIYNRSAMPRLHYLYKFRIKRKLKQFLKK